MAEISQTREAADLMRNQTTDGGIQLQGTPSGVIRAAVDSGAPVVRGHLRPRRLSYVVIEQDEYRTQSMDYIPIPDVAVRFTVKSRRRSDVVAVFNAMSFGGQIEEVWVRARLDKTGSSVPAEVTFSGADDAAKPTYIARCHSYQFVFTRVRPGRHRLSMEFRSFSGEMVFIHRPSLVVAHQ